MLFTKNCDHDTPPRNIPTGIKNMFATTCSNPIATKAKIGNQIPSILPIISSEAIARYTARHTSQLQPIALQNTCIHVKDAVAFPAATKLAPPSALVLAMVSAPAAHGSTARIPLATARKYATNRAPTRLKTQLQAQFLASPNQLAFFVVFQRACTYSYL